MGNVGRGFDRFNEWLNLWMGRIMGPVIVLLMVVMFLIVLPAGGMALLQLIKNPPRLAPVSPGNAPVASLQAGAPTLEGIQSEYRELKSLLASDPTKIISLQRLESRADYIEKRLVSCPNGS